MQSFMKCNENYVHLSIHTYKIEKIINRHVHTSKHKFKRILKYVYVYGYVYVVLRT